MSVHFHHFYDERKPAVSSCGYSRCMLLQIIKSATIVWFSGSITISKVRINVQYWRGSPSNTGTCLLGRELLCCCLTNSSITRFYWTRIWYAWSLSPDSLEPLLVLLVTFLSSCITLGLEGTIPCLSFAALKKESGSEELGQVFPYDSSGKRNLDSTLA